MERRGKIKADLQIMAISTMNRAAANRHRKHCGRVNQKLWKSGP